MFHAFLFSPTRQSFRTKGKICSGYRKYSLSENLLGTSPGLYPGGREWKRQKWWEAKDKWPDLHSLSDEHSLVGERELRSHPTQPCPLFHLICYMPLLPRVLYLSDFKFLQQAKRLPIFLLSLPPRETPCSLALGINGFSHPSGFGLNGISSARPFISTMSNRFHIDSPIITPILLTSSVTP